MVNNVSGGTDTLHTLVLPCDSKLNTRDADDGNFGTVESHLKSPDQTNKNITFHITIFTNQKRSITTLR